MGWGWRGGGEFGESHLITFYTRVCLCVITLPFVSFPLFLFRPPIKPLCAPTGNHNHKKIGAIEQLLAPRWKGQEAHTHTQRQRSGVIDITLFLRHPLFSYPRRECVLLCSRFRPDGRTEGTPERNRKMGKKIEE